MSKKTNIEEQIVTFFTNADEGKVETLFNVVKGIVKNRAAKPVAVKAATRKSRTSSPNSNEAHAAEQQGQDQAA